MTRNACSLDLSAQLISAALGEAAAALIGCQGVATVGYSSVLCDDSVPCLISCTILKRTVSASLTSLM